MQACGLLGAKLGHSYSPRIHRLLGDYEYLLYEKTAGELPEFLRSGSWSGLNVTIPYKKTVCAFCSELSEIACRTGSVNTLVKRPDGTIYGDNTDAFGFSCLLQENRIQPAGKKALILGNGGACASVKAVLEDAGAEVIIISRKGPFTYENLELHKDAELLVNTTPVGMYPDNGKSPVDLRLFPNLKAVLDIIYNPSRTALLLQAEELGIPCADGLLMLVAQARRSSELFTGTEIPEQRIREITDLLSFEMRNLILIGMPGSGKSTVAKALGRLTGREVLEADELFSERYQITPADCIEQQGEGEFRRLEQEILREIGKSSGKIISTGGGCVTVPENYPLLHQNGILIWIQRDLKELSAEGRPLSQRSTAMELYQQRKTCYERFADITVENQQSPEQTAEQIPGLLGAHPAQPF